MRIFRSLAIALCISAVSISANADDLNPAPWRGQADSVFVEFDRADPQTPLDLVQAGVGLGGFPLYQGDPDGGGPIQAGGPVAQIVGIQPITPQGGIYDIFVRNVVDPYQIKDVQIQITYSIDLRFAPGPNTSVAVVGGNPIADSYMDLGFGQTLPPSGVPNEVTIYELWAGQIFPNPDWEIFQIEVPGRLDQVVIDTISYSIPTPAAAPMALLAIGGLAVRRRRHG